MNLLLKVSACHLSAVRRSIPTTLVAPQEEAPVARELQLQHRLQSLAPEPTLSTPSGVLQAQIASTASAQRED